LVKGAEAPTGARDIAPRIKLVTKKVKLTDISARLLDLT
jgi:hypothetical protein